MNADDRQRLASVVEKARMRQYVLKTALLLREMDQLFVGRAGIIFFACPSEKDVLSEDYHFHFENLTTGKKF